MEGSRVQEGSGDVGSIDGQVGGDVSIAGEEGQVGAGQHGQEVVCNRGS